MTFYICVSTDRARAVRPILGTSCIGRTSFREFVAEAVIHTGYSCLGYCALMICTVHHCSSQVFNLLGFDYRRAFVLSHSQFCASVRGNVNTRPITSLLTTICEWMRLSTYSRILPLRYVIGQESDWFVCRLGLRVAHSIFYHLMVWTSLKNPAVCWVRPHIELRIVSSPRTIRWTSTTTTLPNHSMPTFPWTPYRPECDQAPLDGCWVSSWDFASVLAAVYQTISELYDYYGSRVAFFMQFYSQEYD